MIPPLRESCLEMLLHMLKGEGAFGVKQEPSFAGTEMGY